LSDKLRVKALNIQQVTIAERIASIQSSGSKKLNLTFGKKWW
jgi:hypothetical protein